MPRREREEPEPGTLSFGARARERKAKLQKGGGKDLRVSTAKKTAEKHKKDVNSVLEDKEYN